MSDRRREKARPLHGSRAASLGLPEHIVGGVIATPWIADGFRMRTSYVRRLQFRTNQRYGVCLARFGRLRSGGNRRGEDAEDTEEDHEEDRQPEEEPINAA